MSPGPDGTPALTASFTHPEMGQRPGPAGVWFGVGLAAHDLDLLADAANPRDAGDRAVHRNRDASVVFVAIADGTATRLIAWKGLLSISEIFYAATPDGGWYLTDHFRNAVAMIPASERQMSDEALLQHYIGAAVYDRVTYSRGVARLANGDRLDLDLATGATVVANFSRHVSTATDEPLERHLDRLDGAFEDVTGPLQSIADLGIGFSGGVDSTLLLSYLGDHGTPITIIPGSPEFDAETGYARQAANLMGRVAAEVRLDEAGYHDRLADNIETLGMPVESYVTPVLASLYEYPSSVFMVGDGADSIFGSGRGIRRIASVLAGRRGRGMLRVLESVPGPVGRRSEQIGGYAALFAEPPDSPDGYAGRSLEYHGDNTLAYEMFGATAVTDLYRRLLQGVSDRVDLETPEHDHFFRHIEMTQWRYIFADLAMVGNHAAQGLGKWQAQPFSSWRVISEHLKVPARQRYYKGLSGKWMLKELLTRRVPEYKVNKRKLATALPFARYYRSGPLSDVWDRYAIPEAVPSALHDSVVATPSAVTWKAITHAIWEDRVVSNTSLQPHAPAVSATWQLLT